VSATGVRWYVGIPGSGKTYLALAHLRELIESNGWPALVIDTAGVSNFASIPHARNVREALSWVWGAGNHAAIVPSDAMQVEQLVGACQGAGRVNLLVDEAAYWLSARSSGTGLLRLMRAHRHARANVLLTTQHLTGDVPQEALSCAPRLYVFRCTAPAVLKRLTEEGIDADRVSKLPAREYVEHFAGFPSS
jgi:hypothetical protein